MRPWLRNYIVFLLSLWVLPVIFSQKMDTSLPRFELRNILENFSGGLVAIAEMLRNEVRPRQVIYGGCGNIPKKVSNICTPVTAKTLKDRAKLYSLARDWIRPNFDNYIAQIMPILT